MTKISRSSRRELMIDIGLKIIKPVQITFHIIFHVFKELEKLQRNLFIYLFIKMFRKIEDLSKPTLMNKTAIKDIRI